MTAVPINAIITTIGLNIFSHTESCYFSEIKARVERAAGKPLGDAFLASSLERQGYIVDDKVQPWIVRA